MLKKPFIVVFEGIDGSGKSTQANIIFRFLEENKKSVKLLQEPGSTKVGKIIRDTLKTNILNVKTQLFLFEASRTLMIEKHIKDFEGIVLLDRYYYSTIAYQGYGMGIDITFLKALNRFACTFDNIYYDADIVFLLDIEPEIAIKRLNRKEDIFESIELLEKVRKGYLELAKEYNFSIIDATKNMQEIREYMIKILRDKGII